MELKLEIDTEFEIPFFTIPFFTFNQTRMELKHTMRRASLGQSCSFNQTRMELKQTPPYFSHSIDKLTFFPNYSAQVFIRLF